METKPVIVEELIDSPIEEVWKAITDKDEMKEWYFNLDKFEPVVGFEFRFPGNGHKGEQYIHICRITQVVPNQKLQYSWEYENIEGSSLVTFELFNENGKTRVRLTHSGLESFPKGNPDFAKESFMGGWTSIVKELLKNYMKKD